MRLIRNILGSLALVALIVYTMGLPDHPKSPPAQALRPAAAAIPAPAATDPTLVAGASIAASVMLPMFPATRTHIVDRCFTAEPELNAPVIWGPNAVITAAVKGEWEIVRKLIDAGAPVESTDETGLTALMVAARQGNLEM